MDSKIVYNGKEYTKYGNKWVDSRCCVAPDSVQRELNNQLFSEIDLDSLSANELVSAGDSYKAYILLKKARKSNGSHFDFHKNESKMGKQNAKLRRTNINCCCIL